MAESRRATDAAREAALAEPAEMGAQVVAVGAGDVGSGAGEIGGEIGQVAPVGVERVGAGAALGREHVEEQLDQGFVGWARPAGHATPPQRCLSSLSCGIVTVISRGWGSTNLASEKTPA